MFFSRNEIIDKTGLTPSISTTMLDKINAWAFMYQGNAPWTDEFVKSLRIEKAICREFSNISLSEMTVKASNKTLDDMLKYATTNINEKLQNGLGLGSFIIKPLGDKRVEYIMANMFLPLEFDSQEKLTDVIFFAKMQIDKKYYTRLERHTVNENGLTITNRAFMSDNETSLGKEVYLAYVNDWATLPPIVTYPGMTKPDFGYFKTPIDNDIDGSPCGVSVFDSSIELIEKTDKQFGRLDWEFESGERVVHVDIAALRPVTIIGTGTQHMEMPKLNERLYKGLNLQAGENQELYKEYSPEFRDTSLINGFNAYLRRIEFNACLSYGDLSDVQDVEKTAAEVKIAKKRKYNMVNAIEKNLKQCLEDLVYALAFYNGLTQSGYTFVCDFKDSILTDEDAERKQDLADLAAGIMNAYEYRMKWYGEDEKTAREKLPQQADTLPEGTPVQVPQNSDAVSTAEDAAGKSLNGAQTQSLLTVIAQYTAGSLTIGQAINIISTSIGISKDEAQKIIEGAA